MQQAHDFRQECTCIADVLNEPLDHHSDDLFGQRTLFKGWTIDDIVGHLHMFNVAARLTLEGDKKFASFFAPVSNILAQGKSMLEAQYIWLDGLTGRALYDAWLEECDQVANLYAAADPKHRVKWAGPDMSTRSSITARQMETWAHGQAIFDCMGKKRIDTDRIKNIAHLGVNTFGWTFINRKIEVPDPAPHIQLTSPSGALWEWNEAQDNNRVRGSAVEFCQVVAQTRNIADTQLNTTGETAQHWMSIAQCFAGPPNDPPVPGERRMADQR